MTKIMNTKNNSLPNKLELNKNFHPPTFEEWKEKVEKDLKGKAFERLITETIEGIELQPIYTRKKFLQNVNSEDYPSNGGRRATNSAGYYSNDWLINQKIEIPDAAEFNSALKDALERGQNSILIPFDKASALGIDADYADVEDVGNGGVSISGLNSFSKVLNDIDITKYPIVFENTFSPVLPISLLNAYCKKNQIDITKVNCFLETDPIGFWVKEGELPVPLDKLYLQISDVMSWTEENAPKIKTIAVNTLPYVNSGANAVQELAIMLANAAEYFRAFIDLGNNAETIAKNMNVSLAIGSSFFTEVAKFRAAKILWRNLLKAFGCSEKSQNISLFAISSDFNKTIFDPYVNMLRSTTETFSAIAGGIDGLQISPFDSLFSSPDDFSRRIARNTQLILKEESHFNIPIDPAGGSYFVEELTEELAKKAWGKFQAIEKNGRIIESLKKDFIQNDIEKVYAARIKNISKRKSVIVGTNMFSNPKEEMLKFRKINHDEVKKKRAEFLQKLRVSKNHNDNLEILKSLSELSTADFKKVIPIAASALINGATIGEISSACKSNNGNSSEKINPIQKRRGAELFEELRFRSMEIEKIIGKKPSIFLATMGNVKEYKARADFSRGFFEVGGFDVIYPNGFSSVDNAVMAALESKSDIIVICSTDENYSKIASELSSKIKAENNKLTIILAGYPKEQIAELKANGVDEFIYLGVDAYKIISKLLNKYSAEEK